MNYTFTFRKKFAKDFDELEISQENAILGFLIQYQESGLVPLTQYKGKISPSWKGKNTPPIDRSYAKRNSLWHIHIGLPNFKKSQRGPYYTSDMILHFQWENRGTHIQLVKLTSHYDKNNNFNLPRHNYLE